MALILAIIGLCLAVLNLIMAIINFISIEKRTVEFLQELIDIELKETRKELEDFFKGDF